MAISKWRERSTWRVRLHTTRSCCSGVIRTPVTQHTKTSVHIQAFWPLCPPGDSAAIYPRCVLVVSGHAVGLTLPLVARALPSSGLLALQILFILLQICTRWEEKSHCRETKHQGVAGDRAAVWFKKGRQQDILKSFFEQSKAYLSPWSVVWLRISSHPKSQLCSLEFLSTFVWKDCEPLRSWPEFQAGNETSFPWFHYRNVSHL